MRKIQGHIIYTFFKNGFVEFKESPSMAPSELGGDQLHLTEYCQHFVKMNVVRRVGNTRDVM